MRLVLLALRNLTRNKRRTLLTALAIVFGAMAIVLLQGFVNGFIRNNIEAIVMSKLGAVQVYRKGYLGSDDPLKKSMPHDPALMARIRKVPGVVEVAPRIAFDGMVSNGAESTMFVATAIEPDLEYKVCPERPKRVAKGSTPLTQQQRGMTLIGKTLSDSLKANPGSTLVMQAAGPHASTNALDIEVSGYLPTLNLIESKRMATVQVGFAQELLRMKGQVTEYVVGVHNLEQMNDVAQRLRTELGDDYQVTTWEDIDPATRTRVSSLGYVLIFIAVVLFLLVATGIVNTMMMSVYERVREIGTMLAVGVRRWQVTALFLLEAMALGLTSSVFGSLLGYVVVLWLGQRGIPMRPPGGDLLWTYPHVQPSFMLIVIGFSITGAVLSALYPAYKASRLSPTDALRAT
ncbi:MAG TPA: FtsX-like permease family protein [Pseudomonadota bacterium]|jgi:putative ABC transport system permease protein|nr:FtsX-like permease family protein [Pseudomonadota bacterium]HNF96875.1 FtsX-like permease family protein [Pseudomonadota bacterium]HNK44905.1 FtsX-like permease family protein [Pseudomonadota bacterium]HNN50895.1 FtsX-like permease family protein [Pseudomonadota bacterium]